MSPKFLLIAHAYFADQKSTDQKYRKAVIFHYMTTYSPNNSCFKFTMKLLMAQLHNTDFVKPSCTRYYAEVSIHFLKLR